MHCKEFTFQPEPLQAFLRFPHDLYADDRAWVPPQRAGQAALFQAAHPFYTYGETENIVIWEDGAVAGRIGAAINRRLTSDGKPTGLIGFYESIDDGKVAAHLFEHAYRFFHRHGVTRVLGPINFSTWHSYRLVTEGWDGAPFLSEPYTKPYYPAQWAAAGFQPVANYESTEVDDLEAYAKALQPKFDACRAAGFSFRPFDPRRFETELRLLFDLAQRIFAGNLYYSPVEWQEFAQLYAGAGRLLQDRLSWWAIDPSGQPVGFVFGYPDKADAVRRMAGQTGLKPTLRYLLTPRPRRAVLKTLGVLPQARGAHVGTALTHLFHESARSRGYAAVIHALMLEDNHSRRISNHGSSPLRCYAVYEGPA